MELSEKFEPDKGQRKRSLFTLKTSKMTRLIDKFFIHIGFNRKGLQASSLRGWLYVGMVFLIGFITAFFIMSVLS